MIFSIEEDKKMRSKDMKRAKKLESSLGKV
jgi:hypothetical protein